MLSDCWYNQIWSLLLVLSIKGSWDQKVWESYPNLDYKNNHGEIILANVVDMYSAFISLVIEGRMWGEFIKLDCCRRKAKANVPWDCFFPPVEQLDDYLCIFCLFSQSELVARGYKPTKLGQLVWKVWPTDLEVGWERSEGCFSETPKLREVKNAALIIADFLWEESRSCIFFKGLLWGALLPWSTQE